MESRPLTRMLEEVPSDHAVSKLLARVYPVGKIHGIPIKIHSTLAFLLAFAVLSGLFRSGGSVLLNLIFYGPVLLGAVLIHELSHALVALAVGGSVDEIVVWPLGGFCQVAHSNDSARCFLFHDILIAAAGPISHVPQALAWHALSCARLNRGLSLHWTLRTLRGSGCSFWDLICDNGYRLNISLLLFNLFVPVYPLDGGRVFASLLQLCLSKTRSAKVVAGVSLAIGLGTTGWGVNLWLGHDQMAWLTIFMGVYMIITSHELFDLLKAGRLSDHPLFKS